MSGNLGLAERIPTIPRDEVERVQELVQKQSQYVFDPEKWAYDTLGFSADTWQAEAFHNFIEHRHLAISTGTGTGKTAFDAVLILFFLANRPFPKVPCTAPSAMQLTGALWAEIGKWRRKSDKMREMFKWTKTAVTHRKYPENWWAVARTARLQAGKATTETLQGLHEEHIMMLVEEASGVPDQVMNAVDGAITTPGACVVMTSNPTRRTGYFYRTITDPRLSIEHGGPFKIMHVSCETAAHCDPEHISRAIRIYGKESDFYRVKVLGLPPRAEAAQLITPEQIYDAHMRHKKRLELESESESEAATAAKIGDARAKEITEVTDKIIPRPNRKEGIYQIPNQTMISCDPARYGDDPSVFLVRRGQDIIRRETCTKMDGEEVATRGFALIKEYRADHFCVDVIGIGASVVDNTKRLIRGHNKQYANVVSMNSDGTATLGANALRTIVHAVTVGSSPIPISLEDKKKKPSELGYFNLRSQLFWTCRTHIDLCSICIDTEILDEELQSLHYGWDDRDKNIKLESKDLIKKELKRSPNDADSFALLFFPDLLQQCPSLIVAAQTFGIGSTGAIVEEDAGTISSPSLRGYGSRDPASSPPDSDPTENETGRISSTPTFNFGIGNVGAKRYSRLSFGRGSGMSFGPSRGR